MLAGRTSSSEVRQLTDWHHSSSATRPLGDSSIRASPLSATVIDEDQSMRSGSSCASGRVGLCENRAWLRIEPAPIVNPNQLPRISHQKYDSAPEWCRKSLRLVARGCHHILWERLFWSVGCGAAHVPLVCTTSRRNASLGAHTTSGERKPNPNPHPHPFTSSHIWKESFFPCVLCIPVAFCWSYLLYYEHINRWDRSTWTFVETPVAFLLLGKMKISYDRWWEGRNHLGCATKCCHSLLILLRPRVLQGHVVAYEGANNIRRYSMLYYWLLCFQLLGMAPDQGVVMHHLKEWPEEEEEVLGRKGNRALTALAWLSSSIGDLAEAEIMTQHEMQEALARVDEMTRAFEGAAKIKGTPIPMSLEHCCAVLANLYVYSAPIALASDFISQNESAGTPRLGFREVTLRTMFASFWLGLAIFGIFEMGNCFTDPFGDDPADLGAYMMAAGHGLEADLRCMLESHVPLSRLCRMSGRHIYRGRGTPIACSGGELERGGENPGRPRLPLGT